MCSCPSCPIGAGRSQPKPSSIFSTHSKRKSRSSRSLVYRSETCFGAWPDQKCRVLPDFPPFANEWSGSGEIYWSPPFACSMAWSVACKLSLSLLDCRSWAPVEVWKSNPFLRFPTKSLSIFARGLHRSISLSPALVLRYGWISPAFAFCWM